MKNKEKSIKTLDTIIRRQQLELLKTISSKEGWDFKELVNKYLPKSDKIPKKNPTD
jgi:hypothetical protein